MPPSRPDPVAEADDAARSLAAELLQHRHAALAYLDPHTQTPAISRIGFGLDPQGCPVTLISALAPHTGGLRANPACSVMLGEVGAKGDPLTHPRLMIRCEARFVAADGAERAQIRQHWLAHHPKSALYIDFADFAFVQLCPVSALLNAGFARAFRLSAKDLGMPGLP